MHPVKNILSVYWSPVGGGKGKIESWSPVKCDLVLRPSAIQFRVEIDASLVRELAELSEICPAAERDLHAYSPDMMLNRPLLVSVGKFISPEAIFLKFRVSTARSDLRAIFSTVAKDLSSITGNSG